MKRGFTLIELIIVIALIAILAGAMVPMFRASREDARRAKALAELDAIKSAALVFHADTGFWPTGGAVGADEGLVVKDNAQADASAEWKGPYLDEWKKDPWGTNYKLTFDDPKLSVNSYGFDKELGGVDDLTVLITPDIAIN